MSGQTPNRGLHIVSGSREEKAAELAAYRPYTRALLRRYFRVAIDMGRLPSILGGLCFRARVSSYKLRTFEDAAIFVHDIERVFEQINRDHMEIIAGVIMLEYSLPEAALRIGITVQRAERRYASALDALSRILLKVGLLRPVFTSQDEDAPAHTASALPKAAAAKAGQTVAAQLPPKIPPASAHFQQRAAEHRKRLEKIQ